AGTASGVGAAAVAGAASGADAGVVAGAASGTGAAVADGAASGVGTAVGGERAGAAKKNGIYALWGGTPGIPYTGAPYLGAGPCCGMGILVIGFIMPIGGYIIGGIIFTGATMLDGFIMPIGGYIIGGIIFMGAYVIAPGFI
ncbi:MAG: hypothetical protein WBX11_16980, partial [Thiobacillaceae bacterium]